MPDSLTAHYNTIFIIICQSFFILASTYIFKNYTKHRDIKLRLNYISLFHSLASSFFFVYTYINYGLPDYDTDIFTFYGKLAFYFSMIYYITDIPNCLKLNNMMYFYHHLITICIIVIMAITENYAGFFRAMFVAESSGAIVNLRNILFKTYGNSIPKFFQWVLIAVYFAFRGILGFYFSYEYLLWLFTMELYTFRTFLHILSFIGTSFIVFVSCYWALLMVKQQIKIDKKKND